MLKNIKDFVIALIKSKQSILVGMLVRWAMKVLGGMFLSFGISEGNAEITLASIATILIGIIISIVQSGKIAFLLPSEFRQVSQIKK